MSKGSYLLIVKLNTEKSLKVGALGIVSFKPGYYIYVGSAMSGLIHRIKRHFRKEKKLKWHIDYLTIAANEIFAIAVLSENRLECKLAYELSKTFEGIKSFGCSDCNCKTHLFYSSKNPEKLLTTMLKNRGLQFLKIEEPDDLNSQKPSN